MMKTAFLLISFGTSYVQGKERSLDRIYQELAQMEDGYPVYQAYTSGQVIKKLAGQGAAMDTVEEALDKAAADGVECLCVVPTHMIPGIEWKKMMGILSLAEKKFLEMRIAPVLLEQPEDCRRLVPVMEEILELSLDREYLLMGHGTTDEANLRYHQMNEAFWEAGWTNVHIAAVEGTPGLSKVLSQLPRPEERREVLLHPFLIVAGDHATNDMAGESHSFLTAVLEAGYRGRVMVKGLGEYPQFRSLYIKKAKRLLQKEETAGVLYGVGVGPGDPEQITLKAARILRECDGIGIPARTAGDCTAYQIARKAVPEIESKPVYPVPIPMMADQRTQTEAYDQGSRKLLQRLAKGERIAFLNLGDPTVYGTYMEIHQRVKKAGKPAVIINGVPSFCAAAAALDTALGLHKESIHILPGSGRGKVQENAQESVRENARESAQENTQGNIQESGCIEEILEMPGTKVIMKSGSKLADIRKKLLEMEAKGKVKAQAAVNCGMENQRLYRRLQDLEETSGYFTTILVKSLAEEDSKPE